MTDLFHFTEKVNLSGCTLLIPSVSVGNVPQLTVDFLITTYNFKKVATIWHPAIVSSVGADPYRSDATEICTACELYFNQDLNLALIQLRSTLETKLTVKFFNDLKKSLTELKVKEVVILSSAFDYELHNISNNKFFYISNKTIENMETNGIKVLEPSANGKYILNGSGYALKLFEMLKDTTECTLLLKYISEGDNRPDAYMMLEKLFTLCKLPANVKKITLPSSWEYVFGGPAPIGIY